MVNFKHNMLNDLTHDVVFKLFYIYLENILYEKYRGQDL